MGLPSDPEGGRGQATLPTSEAEQACPTGSERYLLVIEGVSSSIFPLPETGIVLVGRTAQAALRLQHSSISRRHAKLVLTPSEVEVADLDSRNGTSVNGERIAGARRIASGDVVSVGDVVLVLHCAGTAAGRPPVRSEELRHRIEEEVLRSTTYGRSLSLLAVSCADPSCDRGELAVTIASEIRSVGVVGPWERNLVVVLPEVDPEGAEATASQILGALGPAASGIRIGVASPPMDGCDPDTLLAAARAATAAAQPGAIAMAAATIEHLDLGGGHTAIIADPAMRRIFELLRKLAPSDLPVLVLGETGAGKENVAQALHYWSPRRDRPLVAVNCAAIHETLVESELFGHQKGAFTGAVASKPGLLETAEGGTVFLDEVGDLPPAVQAKLLRALETKRLTRLGDVREREVVVRIVAATHHDLEVDVESGRFRKDLFFRLSAARVCLPPLRDRRREIPALARAFLAEACQRMSRPPMVLSPAAMRRLLAYRWPGNVRELRHVIEYVAVTVSEGEVLPDHLALPLADTGGLRGMRTARPVGAALACAGQTASSTGVASSLSTPSESQPALAGEAPAAPDGPSSPSPTSRSREVTARVRPLEKELRDLERARIVDALNAAAGIRTRAAQILGMPRRTLVLRLRQYGLSAPRRRGAGRSGK